MQGTRKRERKKKTGVCLSVPLSGALSPLPPLRLFHGGRERAACIHIHTYIRMYSPIEKGELGTCECEGEEWRVGQDDMTGQGRAGQGPGTILLYRYI